MNLSAEISDKLSTRLREIVEQLEGPGRVAASEAMGIEVQICVVLHLRFLADTRHRTAERLGASPTNYIAGAVDAASAAGVVQADGEGVSLRLRHPIVARAFRDIHIEAKSGGALTIPINAIAYGRRAGEFEGLFKRGNVLFLQRDNVLIALFVLVRSVTQRQDRSLMPSDDEIATAAANGLRGYVRQTLQLANSQS